VDAPLGKFPGSAPNTPEDLEPAVRSFLEEEFERIDGALDRIAKDAPDLPLAKSLRQEAQHQLYSGELTEAVVLLRDLRRVLTGLERNRKRLPLAAPWDESVEELFDRVQARASAMSRAPATVPELDEEEDLSVALRVRRRAASATPQDSDFGEI